MTTIWVYFRGDGCRRTDFGDAERLTVFEGTGQRILHPCASAIEAGESPCRVSRSVRSRHRSYFARPCPKLKAR